MSLIKKGDDEMQHRILLLSVAAVSLLSGCSGKTNVVEEKQNPVVTVYGRPVVPMSDEPVEFLTPEEMDEVTTPSAGGMGTIELDWSEIDSWVSENKVKAIQKKKLENGRCSLLYWTNSAE
jgi:hypothetical protein